jgi:hypothetical protein
MAKKIPIVKYVKEQIRIEAVLRVEWNCIHLQLTTMMTAMVSTVYSMKSTARVQPQT